MFTDNGNIGINSEDPAARFAIRNDFWGQRSFMSVMVGDKTPFRIGSTGKVTIDHVNAGVALRVKASSTPHISNIPFHVSAANDVDAIYVTRAGDVRIGIAQQDTGPVLSALRPNNDSNQPPTSLASVSDDIIDKLIIHGPENNGKRATLKILSGTKKQTMLLDGNEIDTLDNNLFLNHNSHKNVILATGGGKVGIGLTDPRGQLSVKSASHQLVITDSSNNDKTWALASHQNSSGMALWENGNIGRFVVTSGGNVGIGTMNPNHELVIQGNDPALQIRDDTTNNSANAARLELLERANGNFDGGAFFWWNGSSNKLLIGTKANGTNTNILVVDRATKSVGIGTQNPGNFRLAVNGSIRAKEIVVESSWSDFVFEPNYELPTLETVEAHILKNRHLPGIPSTDEVSKHGVKVGEMESKLLQKIEELTLYLIEMHKRIGALEQENVALRNNLRPVTVSQAEILQ